MPCPYSGSFFFFTHICSTVSTHFPHLPNTMINYASTPRLSYTRAPFNSTQLLKASSLSSPTVSPLHPCWCPGLKNNWLRDRYLALSACLPKSEEIHNVNGSHLLHLSWNPPLTRTPDPLNLLHFPCTTKVAILDLRMDTWVTEYCIFSWPLTLFNPSSLSLFLPSFTASTWKTAVVCNDVLPTSCFSSFSASSSHLPAPFPQSLSFLLITNEDTKWTLFPFSTWGAQRPQKKTIFMISPLHIYILHFHLSIRAILSKCLICRWFYLSQCHLNH